MKNVIIILIGIIFSSCESNEGKFYGKIIDQDGKSLKNVTIHVSIPDEEDFTITSKCRGRFEFNDTFKDKSFYLLRIEKNGYLRKHITLPFYKKNKDSLNNITIVLRERKAAIINTTLIKEKDLGISIGEAIKKYKIDTLEMQMQEEPPGVYRGIQSELGDSTIIYLQFPQVFYYDRDSLDLMSQKVTGIGLAFTNCTSKAYGKDFVWYGLRNPYCKKKILRQK